MFLRVLIFIGLGPPSPTNWKAANLAVMNGPPRVHHLVDYGSIEEYWQGLVVSPVVKMCRIMTHH